MPVSATIRLGVQGDEDGGDVVLQVDITHPIRLQDLHTRLLLVLLWLGWDDPKIDLMGGGQRPVIPEPPLRR